MYFTHITDAVRRTRPTDKITKVISNKIAIVQSLYTNGKYSPESVAILNQNQVTFAGELQHVKAWLKSALNVPKFSFYHKYVGSGKYRNVRCDNRPYIKRTRKLAWELTKQGIIKF